MHDLETTLRVGALIRGRYRVTDILGQGTSGAVYLVIDERHPASHYTLKEVMYSVGEGRSSSPFDAAALKRLNHPALPDIDRVFSGEDNDRFYIVKDYVEGSNLEEVRLVMPGKRFSLHAALTMMSPILDAISYLHQQQPHLVHGDIKPSNIIVPFVGTGSPTKLVDFGGITTPYTDTAAQQHILNYRAPEQFNGKASRRTDIYGLGATFYTLLSGKMPVEATDRLASIREGGPDPLLPVNQINPFLQPVVADAISRAMSLGRNDRFASVEQFRQALWQVMHFNEMGPQTLDFPVVFPIENHTKADAGPDSSALEADFPALIAYALMQSEAASAGVTSGPLLAPTTDGEDPPPTAVRRKKRRVAASGSGHGTHRWRKRATRASFRVVLVLLLVCVIGSGVAVAGYQTYNGRYQNVESLAQGGTRHLQTALSFLQAWQKEPLDAPSITRAQREFAAASTVFTQLDAELRASPGVATLIPGYSTRLNAAFHVLPVAQEIAHAGIAGCDALNLIIARLHEPFGRGYGIKGSDLTEIRTDFGQVEANINSAIARVKALQPGDLQFDARMGKAVGLFHRYLPTVQAFLQQTDGLLPILPALLGTSTPAYYLVEILDSTQLRPGGGFIKNYGFATLLGGRLSRADITDTNLLDNRFANAGQTIPYPIQYKWFDLSPIGNGWNLRDSNLDADFPTAAKFAEQNYYAEGGIASLQGVIAITTTLMERALAITGPIPIPQLGKTVTAHNLVNLIHAYQQGSANQGATVLTPGASAGGSRYFTELLTKVFLDRIHTIRGYVVPQLFAMLVSSLRTKDLQMYFTADPAENLFRLAHIDAAIQAPPVGDSFFAVDANIAADTANQFITNTMDDRVTIDENGNATHHTTLRYAWTGNGKVFGAPLYSDYVRIYVPPGSALQQQQGWKPDHTSKAFGREVWAGSFTLSSGQSNTITLGWTEKGVAKKDAAGWHYHYLVQRQAGVTWALNEQVTLPACVVKMNPSGGLKSLNSRTASLTQSLTEDRTMGIDYSC